MHAQLPPLPDGIRLLNDEEIRRLRDRDPTVPRGPDQCSTCNGARTFEWWNDDRTGVVTYDCPCKDQWISHTYLAHCGVGLDYARLGWRDLEERGWAAATQAIEGYVTSDSYVHAGIGMIFTGTSGTGKTLAATLMLKSLLSRGYDGYFTRFSEAVDLFMSGWRDPEEKRWFHRRIKNSQVLVMDDLGREGKGRIETTSQTVEEVIRHRVANARPTIITSNKSPDTLGHDYGALSLLSVSLEPVVFEGDAFWAKQRERSLDEAKRGLTRPIVFA